MCLPVSHHTEGVGIGVVCYRMPVSGQECSGYNGDAHVSRTSQKCLLSINTPISLAVHTVWSAHVTERWFANQNRFTSRVEVHQRDEEHGPACSERDENLVRRLTSLFQKLEGAWLA